MHENYDDCSIIEETADVPMQVFKMDNRNVAQLIIPKAQQLTGRKANGKFTCLQCGRSYMRKDSLQRHVHWECNKEPQFQCPFCPQRCKRKAHWLRHIRPEDLSITGLKWAAAWQRWSAVPSIMWRSGGSLGKSLGSGSSSPEGFNCPACGRVYKLKSSLRNHQKWECGKDPQFQCPHCVYRAKQKMHIARHMERFFASLGWNADGTRRISRNSNDVPAPLAPQRRARLHCPSHHVSRNNNRPINISALDRRHNCARCGKSYKNAYILKRHTLYECGKAPSFSCPHCAFSSKYERNLKAHINHRHMDVQSQSSATINQRA
ncbi:zinc finger protein CKR1-like [Leptopilina heterotoma]|uniref:zinc finger protein CKR1-like n=1 Tax=Leptopilina heterotoma TaxID=63436 RepID=UPI001CA9A9C4|nr:zinc finger protein CKR1-like [Leptopilina heterotoma]